MSLLEGECPHEPKHIHHLRLDRVSPSMNFKKWLNLWDTQALLAFVSLSLSLRKVRRESQNITRATFATQSLNADEKYAMLIFVSLAI